MRDTNESHSAQVGEAIVKSMMWVKGLAAVLMTAGVALAQGGTSDVPASVSQVSVVKKAKHGGTNTVSKAKHSGTNTVAKATRESVITAKKIEFDNKEGVILFDEDVLVDDEQFVMRSDRLLVFMQGTNDVQQIMAVGRVNITNENRAASCDKAVYTKKDGQIVMTGKARLMQQGKETGEVTGDRIVIWMDDERMEVYPGRVVLPPGTFNKGDRKFLP